MTVNLQKRGPAEAPHPVMWLLWLSLFVGVPGLVARQESRDRPIGAVPPGRIAGEAVRPQTPPPAVEPVKVYALDSDKARAVNAAIPFSPEMNPAARPFLFGGSQVDLARATDCLAAAQIYEAGDDPVGEQAVAQVVLNRVRHPAFPSTVCGVVFQGQERSTGCQFTFTCDGALARTPSPGTWDRAREIARAALGGKVYRPVGYATHYHTDWVLPYWSSSLDKVAAVGTHLFFRWRGWWGTPPAFRKGSDGGEPLIARIARLSPAHEGAQPLPGMPVPGGAGETAAVLAARPAMPIDAASLGKSFDGARLVAVAPGAKGFIVELGWVAQPDDWPRIAATLCAGRPECRIMGWRLGMAPVGFPLSQAQMDAMAFAYLHNSGTGLKRVLWNCKLAPRPRPEECMRTRVPVAAPRRAEDGKAPVAELSGVRRRERFETVKIVPVVPTTASPIIAPKAR